MRSLAFFACFFGAFSQKCFPPEPQPLLHTNMEPFSLQKSSGTHLGGQKVTFPKKVLNGRNDTSVLGAILGSVSGTVLGPFPVPFRVPFWLPLRGGRRPENITIVTTIVTFSASRQPPRGAILGPLLEAAGSRNPMNLKVAGAFWLQRGAPFGCCAWDVFGRVFDGVLGSFWGPFWDPFGPRFWWQSGARLGATLGHCQCRCLSGSRCLDVLAVSALSALSAHFELFQLF